jgi:anti-sigma factor RsiW
MTQAERDELIDLYVDDALPEALRAAVEAYLMAHPEAAADAATLQAAISRLKAAPGDRPDTWFTERALDRLLREHAEAQDTETTLLEASL